MSEVNTNCIEGRMLVAALSILTTEGARASRTYDTTFKEIDDLQKHIYEDNPLPDFGPTEKLTFRKALERLINSHSLENLSNTPDFILADFICLSLAALDTTIKIRDDWYGGKQSILDSEKGKKWY